MSNDDKTFAGLPLIQDAATSQERLTLLSLSRLREQLADLTRHIVSLIEVQELDYLYVKTALPHVVSSDLFVRFTCVPIGMNPEVPFGFARLTFVDGHVEEVRIR